MLNTPSKTYRPFKYPWAMKAAEEHENTHWHEGEANLEGDVADWQNNLTEAERNLVHQILRLFTQSDAQVANNYCEHFIPFFKNNEVRAMLLSFAAREGIHQRAYALLNDTINLPESDYQAFLSYKEMSNKLEFMSEMDMSSPQAVGLSLAKSVFSEGVSLFGAFAMLLNFQRFGKMKGMCEVVRWSILDETEHVQGLVNLFRTWCNENPSIVTDEFKKQIYDMARELIKLEDHFIDLAFELGPVNGLTSSEVKDYGRYLIDRRLTQLGLKPNYNVDCPMPWFDEIMGSPVLANFFESRVTDYQVVGLTGTWEEAYA